MARKKDSPQKAALREMMSTYLKENDVKIKDGADVNAIMRDMMSVILEGVLTEELDEELGYSKYDYRNKDTDNSRNGFSQKTMHTSYGDMELDIPRDRKGEFEPQVIKKYQNTVTQDMEEKLLSMYAKGMTTGDIESHMRDLYGIEISDSTISRVTDKVLPIVKEWQERPLEDIYACIIHQIRNTTRFVSYKDIKPLMADLKRVYTAATEEIALAELDAFEEKWYSKYPKIAKSWRDNWANLSAYFKYPEAIRKLIYTTNAIEGFNRQLRKVTKSKTIFPSDDSLMKMLYLATMDITKKWTGHRLDWGQIHSQLEIYFEERLS